MHYKQTDTLENMAKEDICHKERESISNFIVFLRGTLAIFTMQSAQMPRQPRDGEMEQRFLESVIYFDRSNNVCNQISMTKSTGSSGSCNKSNNNKVAAAAAKQNLPGECGQCSSAIKQTMPTVLCVATEDEETEDYWQGVCQGRGGSAKGAVAPSPDT